MPIIVLDIKHLIFEYYSRNRSDVLILRNY